MAEKVASQPENTEQSRPFAGGGWAYTIVILISFLLLGLPFLGPLLLVITPILFLISVPALIWFLHENKKARQQADTG